MKGLTSNEAARLLASVGSNGPAPVQRGSVLMDIGRLLFAVALGVGLAPEFLPMTVSVTLTPVRRGCHTTASSSSAV
jgi:hypothetical protein